MSGINDSNKNNNSKPFEELGSENDWAKIADNADKKAQEELEKIKREAHEELTSGKERFHNPNDK